MGDLLHRERLNTLRTPRQSVCVCVCVCTHTLALHDYYYYYTHGAECTDRTLRVVSVHDLTLPDLRLYTWPAEIKSNLISPLRIKWD